MNKPSSRCWIWFGGRRSSQQFIMYGCHCSVIQEYRIQNMLDEGRRKNGYCICRTPQRSVMLCMVAICCNIQFTCLLRPYQPRFVDHHTDLNPNRIIKDFQLTGGRNDQLLVKATQYTRSHCSQLKFKMWSSVLTHSVHFAFSQTNLTSSCF